MRALHSVPTRLAIVGLFLAVGVPARAVHPPEFDQAISQLQQAENLNDGSEPKALLQSTLNLLSKLTWGKENKPRKKAAEKAIKGAIGDLAKNNSEKAATAIQVAITKIQETIADLDQGAPAATTEAPKPTAQANRAIPTVKLTEDQARAVVLIKGDIAEGTGFMVKTADGPVVITNIHVISNNPNVKITTNTGKQIVILSYKGAVDRDLAMIAIKDDSYSYLEMATDISATVQPGDEVITPGNSQGGEVMLNTDGKVLGVGPQRIEFDNPIYHGNSGGPVFHVKSGKVVSVVTEAIKVDVSNVLDKASFANRNSAIARSMRYFGMRVDNVPKWEDYDWKKFQNETAFLDQFEQRSEALDSFLYAPNDNKPEDILWQKDDMIVKANNNFFDQASGSADMSQKVDAARALAVELRDVADTDMDAIANMNNFYAFDQLRAKDEIAYRKALQTAVADVSNNVSRMGSLPRSNR